MDNDVQKASTFSNYYLSVFSSPGARDDTKMKIVVSERIGDIEVSYNGIVKLLISLKPEKVPGPDRIPNYVLKSCSEIITHYLLVNFYRSLEDDSIPEDWKFWNVVPVHKYGSKDSVENYRPISLTSQCSKLMEHMISTNLNNHIESNNIYTGFQHGFRAGYSCNTQMVEFYHGISLSLIR